MDDQIHLLKIACLLLHVNILRYPLGFPLTASPNHTWGPKSDVLYRCKFPSVPWCSNQNAPTHISNRLARCLIPDAYARKKGKTAHFIAANWFSIPLATPSLGYPSGTTCSLTHIMTDSFNRPPQYLWLPVENYCISTHWTTGSFNWPPQSQWWNVKKYHISTHWTTGSFNRPPWSPWLPVNKYCILTHWMTGSFNRPSQSPWLPVEDIAPQPIVKQVLPFLLLFLWLHVEELASWPTWWQVLLISSLTSVVTRKGEFCTSTIYNSSCYIAFSFL